MLQSTYADQILAIHHKLEKTKGAQEKAQSSTSVDKNPAAFCQRLPKKISLRQDMYMEESMREATLLSRHAYRVLRQFQLENLRPTNIYITTSSKEGKALALKYPILLGENGELVAIMKTVRQKLGEGNFGAVFIGMDLDTHKLIALKFHHLGKASKESILNERQVMDDIGRLVTAFESDSCIITADNLAWGSDYKHIIDERAKNELNREEILYRMDMAIKFFEQVKLFHDKNYINCDVKLDNMIWDPLTKQATLIDFGFAKKGRTLQAKAVQGTPIYIAPEVMHSKYSRASDAYACGVALLELFTSHDLFENVENWKSAIDRCNRTQDPEVLLNFFKEAAPDLFENEALAGDLKPIVDVIKNLISFDPQDRIFLSKAIGNLKEHRDSLQFFEFSEKTLQATKTTPIKISFEEMSNPLVKKYVYENMLKLENAALIHPDSLLNILHHATIDNNLKVFENVVSQSKLFVLANHGFAQMLLKHVFENSLEDSDFNFLCAFLTAARQQARFHETLQDLQNMIKEKRAITASARRLKIKKSLDKLEHQIIPFSPQLLHSEILDQDISVLSFSAKKQEIKTESREISYVPRKKRISAKKQ